ncbi:MAG: alcohol dehydrogenase catalytic domain-containing protein, partial [Alicyclobacillus sp.]|nr:alcohol dehydrogenase catalytic domain-containing protein [Alicyclobacillus sp.]
ITLGQGAPREKEGDEMQALLWTGPRALHFTRLPDPQPAAGEVVVRVAYAGICGSDISGYLGHNPLRNPPLVMGHEWTGVVAQVGESVHRLRVGDRVVVNPLFGCGTCAACRRGQPQRCQAQRSLGIQEPGGFAELARVPEQNCERIADLWEAVITEPLACAVRAVRRARVSLGDRVVVIGAGTLGLCCLRLARMSGASHVVLIDVVEEKLAVGTAWGATHTFHAEREDVTWQVQQLFAEGADVVFEAVGLQQTRQLSIDLAARGGRVVWLGLHQERSELMLNAVVRKELEVLGSASYTPEDFAMALQCVTNRHCVAEASWVKVRPWQEAPSVFEDITAGRERAVKVVLAVHPES